MKRNKEFLGQVRGQCEEKVYVGMPTTVSIEYTAGRYGIDDRGSILISRQGVTDWETVQFDKPQETGYSTCTTTGDARLECSIYDGIRPFENAIRVKIVDGCLKEGDKINFIMGDTSEGSLGCKAQTFIEDDHRIKIFVDSFGTNKYAEVPNLFKFRVHSGKCAELGITAPSIASVGETVDIKLRVLDDFGNRCQCFAGNVKLEKNDFIDFNSQLVEFREGNDGFASVKGKITRKGKFIVRGSIEEFGIEAKSNVIKTTEDVDYRIFWSDMHGQNALASGIGSMDEYFSYARDIAAIDVAGWQGNDFEVTDEDWKEVKESTRKYHQPDKFITFLGYEWSGVTSGGGDHNIYYLGDDSKIHRTSRWLVEDQVEEDGSDRYPISELWSEFRGRKDVMAIPHVGGRYGNFDYYDPEFIKLIEVHSHHGTFEWYIKEAMKREMKVGFVGTSDDHVSRLGLSYPIGSQVDTVGASFDVKSGLTGIYAEDLTRDSIWKALNARRCYATTCSRILLDYNINGHIMGEEISPEDKMVLDIEASANEDVDYIEIYNGTDLLDRVYNKTVEKGSEIRRVKIKWGGVRTRYRKKSVKWDGMIYIKKGKIADVNEYAFDRKSDGIVGYNSSVVRFKSQTSGDDDGLIIDIIPDKDCSILIDSLQVKKEISLEDITEEVMAIDLGPENKTMALKLEPGKKADDDLDTGFSHIHEIDGLKEGFNAIFVKTVLTDGNMAWGSPIFIDKQ